MEAFPVLWVNVEMMHVPFSCLPVGTPLGTIKPLEYCVDLVGQNIYCR
jgi:hypothetical protein